MQICCLVNGSPRKGGWRVGKPASTISNSSSERGKHGTQEAPETPERQASERCITLRAPHLPEGGPDQGPEREPPGRGLPKYGGRVVPGIVCWREPRVRVRVPRSRGQLNARSNSPHGQRRRFSAESEALDPGTRPPTSPISTKEVRGSKPSRTCRVETDELLPELDDAGLRDPLGCCQAARTRPSRRTW